MTDQILVEAGLEKVERLLCRVKSGFLDILDRNPNESWEINACVWNGTSGVMGCLGYRPNTLDVCGATRPSQTIEVFGVRAALDKALQEVGEGKPHSIPGPLRKIETRGPSTEIPSRARAGMGQEILKLASYLQDSQVELWLDLNASRVGDEECTRVVFGDCLEPYSTAPWCSISDTMDKNSKLWEQARTP